MTYSLVSNWQSITVDQNSNFRDALKIINQVGYQLCLIQDNEGRLIGMITDSDIRKALLKGVKLNGKVDYVMNRSPLIVSPDLGENEAQQLMIVNNFLHLPVVSNEGKLLGLHVAKQLQNRIDREETFVIMAGGRGKRLIPLTDTCPKPMLPLLGKPILEHLIERAKNDGFNKFVLSVNYLSEHIIDYFQDGSEFNVKINYVHENKPLGTAGSLSLLDEETLHKPIIVSNGDILTYASYAGMVNSLYKSNSDAIMAVRTQVWKNPFGIVHSEGTKLINIEEKPTYQHQVNAGIYALNPSIVSLLKKNQYCDMTDLFALGIERKLNLNIFPLHEAWLDIGRHDDYKAAGKFFN